PRTVLAAAKEVSEGEGVPGVTGAVADLIRVPRGYETAVEAALGDALEYIVTRGEPDALKGIDFLVRRKAGRATFVPLGTVRPGALTPEEIEVVARSGFAKPALELVECEPRFLPAVSHVLGRVVIVDTIENGLLLAKRTAWRLKVVTMDGKVLNPGGSLTGGAAPAGKPDILGRPSEIRALKERASLLAVEMAALKERAARVLTEREILAGHVRILEQQIWAADSQVGEVDKEEGRLRDERERLQERMAAVEVEIERCEAALREGEGKIAAAGEAMERLQAAEAALRAGIAEMQEAVRSAREGREAAQLEVTRLRVSVATLTNARAGIGESLARVEGQLADATRRYESLVAEIERLESARGRLEEDLASGKRRQVECSEESRRADLALKEATAARDGLIEKRAALEGRVHQVRRRAQELQERIHEADLRRARAEVEISSLRERLQTEWGVSEERYGDFEVVDSSAVQPEIARIRGEMDALGIVNLGAIEEYKATLERHDFLQRQVKDMREARESLQEIIREVDRKMSEVFAESFERVRQNFREVFRDVFGGGTADLVLTDADNPLEAGVEIRAQPPGRKIQNLNLLSGGEKAMTAIALLFAILMTRPSPFCVLDEIDAALDDTNVERFGRLLRTFAEKTQFIVITHQKGTMELADTLYGLTMEEPGVSKLISVRLVEKAG
ncbi:MAG: chromosome segregation protein SMC, partial [Firmicutes bacterium]|nr:chromosome segregation protein SMC [Bacillota bacterium]